VTCRVENVIEARLLGESSHGVVFRGQALRRGRLLRIQPGDRREIAISSGEASSYAIEERPALLLSELWLPGEAQPTLALAVDRR
jgi:hypothetical protein